MTFAFFWNTPRLPSVSGCCSGLPICKKSFLNYGYNKQQWIENLRYIGYKFGVVVQGFELWIPMENAYFEAFQIAEKADLILKQK